MQPSLGDAASGLGVAAAFVAFAKWMRGKVSPPPPFTVRRVTSSSDPDLDAALELYEGRFEALPDEMDDSEILRSDIVNDAEDAEFLVIAKRGPQVVAMLHGSYCESHSLFFVWYVAGFKGSKDYGFAKADGSADLEFGLGSAFTHIQQELFSSGRLRDCSQVVAELSDHSYVLKTTLFARWTRRFNGRLYKVDLRYRQPLLTFPNTDPETPMTLVLAELPERPSLRHRVLAVAPWIELKTDPPGYRTALTHDEATRIVGCLYDQYAERDESTDWLTYLQAERRRILDSIGSLVALESLGTRRSEQLPTD